MKATPTKAVAPGPKPAVQIGGESLVERLLPHVKKILAGIVVLAGILTVVFTIKWMKERKHQEATDKLAAALTIADRPVRPAPDPADAKDPKTKPPTGDSFPTAQARAIATLTEADQKGAELSPVMRGSLELTAGKLDDAIASFRKAGVDAGLDGVVAREDLGLALEAKASAEKDAPARQKGLEDALAAFVAMQPDEAGPRRSYALYHQGRMLELLGKRDDAKAAYTKASELAKDESQLSEIAMRQQPPLAEAGNYLPDLIARRLAALGGS